MQVVYLEKSVVEKFNEHHDERGRFASADGGTDVLFEVAPDYHDTVATAAWNSITHEQQREISNTVSAQIIPKVLAAVGAGGSIEHLIGGYMGYTNPSLAVKVDNPDKAVEIARGIGIALSQDGMLTTSETPAKGMEKIGVITVQLPKGTDINGVEKIYNSIYEIQHNGEPIAGGHTTKNDKMAILNFTKLSNSDFRDMVDNKLGGAYKVDSHIVFNKYLSNGTDYNYVRDKLSRRDTAPSGTPAEGGNSAIRAEATALRDSLVRQAQGKSATTESKRTRVTAGFLRKFNEHHDPDEEEIPAKKSNPFLSVVQKFNPNHAPAGTSIGGQFTSSDGGSGGSDSSGGSGHYAVGAITPDKVTPQNIDKFIAERKASPEYKAVDSKLQALQDQTVSGDVRNWSKEKNSDANGNYTAERLALHDKIILGVLTPDTKAPDGVQPQVVILLGQPASGKTSIGAPIAHQMAGENTKLAVVNADDIKAALPEYKGWNAASVHEESTDILEGRLVPQAIANRNNMLIDITGNNAKKIDGMVTNLGSHGYQVHVIDMTLDTHLSISRAWTRFLRGGRFVPLDYAKSVDHNPDRTYAALKSNKYLNSWAQIDSSTRTTKILDEGHV